MDKAAKPSRVAFAVLIISAVLLFNYTLIVNGNWMIHPDDHEAYIIGRNLKNTGSLTYDEPLNAVFEEPVFTPAGAGYFNNKVVPTRAYGIYFLTAFGFLFGSSMPFILIALLGLIGMVFLYKIVALVMDKRKAFLAMFLFAFSVPVIYWSNMLYASIPGLTFFIIGLYLLLKVAYGANARFLLYIGWSVSFALSIWMRYEYALFILLLAPLVIRFRHAFKLRYFLVGVLILVMLLVPVLLLNRAIYDNPFHTGYTKPKVPSEDGQQTTGMFDKLQRGVGDTFRRFFTQDLKPKPARIYRNIRDYVLNIMPMLIVAGILGLLLMLLLPGRNRALALSLLLIITLWAYDTCGGFHWGENQNLVGSTYIRYLLVLYMAMAIFAPVIVDRIRSIFGPNIYRAFLALFLISFLVLQSYFLMAGTFGLEATSEQKEHFEAVNEAASELPEESIIVASVYSKAIVDRRVLKTTRIKNGEVITTTVDYIRELLHMGFPVYLMETPWHSSYLNLAEYLPKHTDDLAVEEIRTGFGDGSSDKIYEVRLIAPEDLTEDPNNIMANSEENGPDEQ